MDLTMIFVTLCPYLATLLLPQVEWKYFHSGPFAFNLSASSEEIIEALLWSSIMAYAVWASSQRFFSLDINQYYIAAGKSTRGPLHTDVPFSLTLHC